MMENIDKLALKKQNIDESAAGITLAIASQNIWQENHQKFIRFVNIFCLKNCAV